MFVMLEERKGCDINATKVINDCWKKEKDAIINATKCWVRAIPGSLQLCAQQHHQRSPQSFALVTHPHSKPFFWNSNTVMKRLTKNIIAGDKSKCFSHYISFASQTG